MKSSRIKHALGASLLSLPFGISVSSASTIDNIVVFGDSLTDMGRLHAATLNLVPPDPPYWQGRTTNGPVWAETLAEGLNAGLRNYAIAGATTGTTNVWDERGLPNAPYGGLQNQITDYLSNSPDTGALHVVWAGSNNFLSIPDDPPAAIATAAQEIASAVKALDTQGVEQLYVVNVPDFGLSPRLSDAGLSAQGTFLTEAFNQALDLSLDAFGLGDVPIVDSAAFQRAAVADPEAFGLTNVTESVCVKQSPEDTFCAIDPDIDEILHDQYLFWDDIHPTRAFHAAFAEEFQNKLAAVPGPGTFALLLFSLIGLASSRVNKPTR